MAEVETEAAPARRSRAAAIMLGLLAVLALLLLGLWLARKPIASNVIDRELARRGVPARYEVKRIGFRTQRLEGLRIGDPKAPDLTADWVEVDLRPTLGAPEVQAIRAGGVRLNARVTDGRLRLGAVERLLPKRSGAPFRLPDLPVALTDARIMLATPAGPATIRVDGAGSLADGFAGSYRAAAPALVASGCTLSALSLEGRVTTRAARPSFSGPFRATALDCGDPRVAAISGALDATLEPALNGWRGAATLASGMVRAGGWSAGGGRAQLDFAGDPARTAGVLRAAGLNVTGRQARAGRAELGGRYVIETARAEQLGAASRAASVRFEGVVSGTDLVLTEAPRLDGIARSVVGTPLAPLMQALARAGADVTNGSAFRASLSVATRGSEGSLRIGSAQVGAGGTALRFAGREGLRLTWPGGRGAQVDGRVVLSGSGVPAISADLRQRAPGAPVSGIARVAPFIAGGSRIVLAPIRLENGRFSTQLDASGPLFGGRVDRASLPLTGRFGAPGLTVNPACVPLSFQRLQVSSLDLTPARLRLCPDGAALIAGGRIAGRVEGPRLRGTLGRSPITLAAGRASFVGSTFRIVDLAARLGSGDRVSRLDVASLEGRPDGGLGGRFSGASGQIANVPLIASDGAGRWRFAQRRLAVSGRLDLADAAAPARFNPVTTEDFALTIRGSDVRAGGTLLQPQTRTELADVTLRHDLGSGVGDAEIQAASIRFTPKGLQPEQLTRLTLGVVASVDGSLAGTGRIAWNGSGVTSTGGFQLRAASLAAPFGPVTGLATDIQFTDLLGLVTAPDQSLTVATINPGILVEEGQVSYRLLPGFRVAVASGRWPFAGGELTLRPTILDFSEEAARNLVFDISGLDAARLVNQLEFSNINATGTFDGTLPMVFDRDGGRVVDGSISSRPPGGTLSYIGQVSNANLGIWGGIAFDALKSIQYQNMTIAVDGRIDGEMISQIRFAGVSRGTIEPVATGLIARVGGQLASKLQRIPFIFNIRIRAPFRGLIAMSRSFDDPSLLIQDQLGVQFQPVQPPSTEDKR